MWLNPRPLLRLIHFVHNSRPAYRTVPRHWQGETLQFCSPFGRENQTAHHCILMGGSSAFVVKTHQYGSKTTSTVDTLRAQLTTRLSHCLQALASRDPPILLFIRKRKLDEQCNSPDSPHHWRIGKQTLALPGVNPWWTLPRRGFDAKSTHLHHVWWNDARRGSHQ